MGNMVDKMCCISDSTFEDAIDKRSNYSNDSNNYQKSSKTEREKNIDNEKKIHFREAITERKKDKLEDRDNFYYRSSMTTPSSEIILNNPNKKAPVRSISGLPITLGTIIRKNNKKIDENYLISKVIGEGGYGSVIKVVHKNTGQVRAMKIISKDNLRPGYTELEIFREINILKKLEHPNIMKLFEFYSDDDSFYLINEFCSEGDLSEKLAKVGRFNEKIVKLLMFQIFSAVLYLHSNNVIHGDLKLENVMVDNIDFHENNDHKELDIRKKPLLKSLSFISSYKEEMYIEKEKSKENNNIKPNYEYVKNFELKLIDFGAAKIFTKYKKQFEDTVGTLVYCSPEVLKNNYDSKCDIWSCGVIMYILLSGEIPFAGETEEEIMKSIMNKKVSFDSSFFTNVSEDAKDLITKCTIYNKNQRLNAKECLKHSFFQNDLNPYNLFNEDLTVLMHQVLNRLRNFSTSSKFYQAILVFIAYNFAEKKETQKLKKIFFAINKDMDGKIKLKELYKAYQENKMRMTKDEVTKIIKEIDFNNSGFIEYEEFIRAALPKEDLFTEVNLKEAFDLFDINKKGFFSSNEMKEVLGMKNNVDQVVVDKILNDIGDKTINFEQFKYMVLEGFN